MCKALELDATMAHPHAVLGSNEMEYDWDFPGGEVEYKKAFELDPNDYAAHAWYAWDIGQISGREQEALAEANRAHQLDPLSPTIGLRTDLFTLGRDSTTRPLSSAIRWQMRTRHSPQPTSV